MTGNARSHLSRNLLTKSHRSGSAFTWVYLEYGKCYSRSCSLIDLTEVRISSAHLKLSSTIFNVMLNLYRKLKSTF